MNSLNVCYYRSFSAGFGMFVLQPVQAHQVLCEYAGEVIGTLLTEIRDAEYQRNGFHSVYMFETEQAVIDATFIGNLGRFINHSCDPNAESEQIKPNSSY